MTSRENDLLVLRIIQPMLRKIEKKKLKTPFRCGQKYVETYSPSNAPARHLKVENVFYNCLHKLF